MKRISRTLTAMACVIGWSWSAATAAPVQVNIGIVTAPSFVHTLSAEKFKEVLDKELPGKYEVVIHHSGALGSETQVLQQLQLGTVQMGRVHHGAGRILRARGQGHRDALPLQLL